MLILPQMQIWDFNLRHLRALTKIAQLGSISAAAKAINITQPAITQAIGKLESLCAQNFFDRRADGMHATPAARLFAARIDRALDYIGSTRVTMPQVRALVAVAESGSYVGASLATGLAQPSLHRAIGDLSVALKRKIVERRGKGIALTDAGRQMARAFRLALSEIDAGLSEMAALGGQEIGRLTIGAMPLSRARILPAAVSAFHRQHPGIALNIIEGSFVELIEPLRDGVIDMMVGALREPAPGSDITQSSIFHDRPVVIGRRDHPALAGPLTIEALAKFPWILPSIGTPLRTQWELMFSRLDAGPNVPIESGSVIFIRQMLIETNFLTLLSPDQVAVELEAKWLVKIADTPDHVQRTIGVSTRSNWQPTALQNSFLVLLMAQVSEARLP